MRVLSKEAERRILHAVDAVERNVTAGDSPTDAVIKAAAAQNLEPGHGRLVAIAYNTGRTALQRNDNDDVFDKAAEFVLADPDHVAAVLVRQHKTAAIAAEPVSSEYAAPPSFLTQQYAAEKRAAAVMPPLPVRDVPPMEECRDKDGMRFVSRNRERQRKVAEAQALRDKAFRTFDEALERLVLRCNAVGGPAVATLDKVAQLRGDAGVQIVLREVVERCPRLAKVAASTRAELTPAELDAYAAAQFAAEYGRKVNSANKTAALIEKTARDQTIADGLANVPVLQASHGAFADLWDGAAEKLAAAGFAPTVQLPMPNRRGADQDDEIRGYLTALDDPAHNQRLDAIRARTTVESLMAQDPVLRGYPAQDVVDGYNVLAQTAPTAVQHPAYLQAMLRRHLGQGNILDPDDVRSNLLGAESEVSKLRAQSMPDMPDIFSMPGQRGPAAGDVARQAFKNYYK